MNNLYGPSVIVIFGASGDLAKRKLMPALYNLCMDKSLPDPTLIVGVGKDLEVESWKIQMKEGIDSFSRRGAISQAEWEQFSGRFVAINGTFEDVTIYGELQKLIARTESEWNMSLNRIYYLSIPPSYIQTVADGLAAAGLSEQVQRDRLVVEKPFGRDLESSARLNDALRKNWQENQVYRIDHYLGKETVQNLLAFRFANALYEPIWDRRYIDHVQITVAEEVGVEKRGGFYEQAGALRDMMQNHILQLLCMVAMEPPNSFDADEVRNKKVDVLRAIRPVDGMNMYDVAVRGQYAAGMSGGKIVPGYRQEPGVDPQSSTETYAALKLFVDNWRWQGVPFYMRTGKRLATKLSQIVIQFRPVPHQMFPATAAEHWEPNRLFINIQPKEGIITRFQAKSPGKGMRLRTVDMDFYYEDSFSADPPEAYETLLNDVLMGDGTLFMRADQEHYAWSIVQPILDTWQNHPATTFPNYVAGTWGPEAGEALIARDGRTWMSGPLPDHFPG